MIETAQSVEPHAPGTYYFAHFRGGVLGPFQPRDEISKAEALTRDLHVIGTYDDQGRLIAMEKWVSGEHGFRLEYGYDEAGEIYQIRQPQ
jgi:hypothetical protein